MMNGPDAESFGQLLRRRRVASGLTQEELAEKASLSWRAISDLERGIRLTPRRDTVALLVGALDLRGDARTAFEALARPSTATRAPQPSTNTPVMSASPGASGTPPPAGRYLGAIPPLPLVAREMEMSRIMAGIEAREGHMLLLAGEPGVGKTRLAQEAMRRARDAGMLVLVGRCYHEHTVSSYYPFLEVLSTAWSAAPRVLREQVAQRYPGLGQLVPDLLSAPPLVESDDPRLRVLRGVEGFLRALTGEVPVALLLDDLHWADSSSLDLLLHLARSLRGERLFVLGAYRDTEVDRAHALDNVLAALLRERLAEVVDVSRLAEAGTGTLIGAHFGVAEVSADLKRLVHEHTDGNPFFIEEVLTALVESGAIYQTEGRWERQPTSRMTVPISVRAVVRQRVGQLPESGQELLRMASVLGQEFDLDVLLDAAGQEEEEALAGLDAALSLRLVEERQVGRGERFAFVHALVGQALYDEAPRFRLRRLHLRAGEALLRARSEQPEMATELARHFLAAADEERAARYAEQAGDEAVRLYARTEAEAHYRTALGLRQTRGERMAAATVGRKLAEVLTAAQRTDEARPLLEEARAVVEELGDDAALALIHHRLAAVEGLHGGHLATVPHLERALALWPVGKEDIDLARLLYDATCSIGTLQGVAAAEPHAQRLVELADRLGDPGMQALSINNMFWMNMGQEITWRDMLAPIDRGIALAEQARDWYILSDQYFARAIGLAALGDLAGALEAYRRAIPAAERGDHPIMITAALGSIAQMCLLTGDWEGAREAARTVQSRDARMGERLLILPWVSGDYDARVADLRRFLEEVRQQPHNQGLAYYARELSDALLQLGRYEEAAELAREVRALLADVSIRRFVAETLPLIGEALVRVGDPEVFRLLDEAGSLIEAYGYAAPRPRLLRARGLYLAREGRLNAALDALQASADEDRGQGALVSLARTLSVLIEVTGGTDDAVVAAARAEHAELLARIAPPAPGLVWARQ